MSPLNYNTNLKISFEKLTAVVLDTHPYAWAWDKADLTAWLAWYTHHSLVLAVSDGNGAVDGLVLLRTVMCADDAKGNTLAYDPEGPVVFVDFVYDNTNRILRALIALAIHRLGARPFVAWERNNQLRIHAARDFVRHTLKEKIHHGNA